MIRMIASDLDGTLLDDRGFLPEITERAIREAVEQGIIFLPITGRAYVLGSLFLETYGLNCDIVLSNGAEIRTSSGQSLRNRNIAPSLLAKILEIYRTNGVTAVLMTADGPVSLVSAERVANSFQGEGGDTRGGVPPSQITKRILDQLQTFATLEEFLKTGRGVQKIVGSNWQTEALENCRRQLAELDGLSVVSSNAHNLEVSDQGATKGQALQFYAALRGIAPEEIAVFGDQTNDISMFQFAAHSFAPGNAVEAAKDAAAYTIASNNEGGVGQTIFAILDRQKNLASTGKNN